MSRKNGICSRLLGFAADFAEMLFVTLFIVLLLFTYVFGIAVVRGESMMNTLSDGDKVIVSLVYNDPEQGDIVVLNSDRKVTFGEDGAVLEEQGTGKCIVKRIIAVEGQELDIDFAAGVVYVDGERVREPYLELGLTHLDEGAFTGSYPIVIPEDCVFVMGDNRPVSKDSRSGDIGLVPVDCIVGKVILRLFPGLDVPQ